MASSGRTLRWSSARSIRLPRLCPASSPLPLKRYSNIAEATLGSVISWFRQLRVSPQAMPPSELRIRPVEPPLSVVVTIPVRREPRVERADITRPNPCPPPNATTRSRSANVRLRINILETIQRRVNLHSAWQLIRHCHELH